MTARTSSPLEAARFERQRLRRRGWAGGFIADHRALVISPLDARKRVWAVVLSVAVLLAWYLAQPLVVALWVGMLDFWQQALGLGAYVTTLPYRLFGFIPFDVPYLGVGAGLPTRWAWWLGLMMTAIWVVGTYAIPSRLLPVAYVLRVVAGFQISAQVFFWFWPEAFPYNAGGYVHGMLIASLFFISLVPVLLGLTYYIFDFSLRQKLALTAMVMLHLIVLTPLQYVAHAWVMMHFSLLFMPVVFLATGLPLDVMVFIAFYSWGFSWPSGLRDERTQVRAGRRTRQRIA